MRKKLKTDHRTHLQMTTKFHQVRNRYEKFIFKNQDPVHIGKRIKISRPADTGEAHKHRGKSTTEEQRRQQPAAAAQRTAAVGGETASESRIRSNTYTVRKPKLTTMKVPSTFPSRLEFEMIQLSRIMELFSDENARVSDLED